MKTRHHELPVYPDLAERESMLRKTWERLDPPFRTPNQVLGRRSTIGCVALEITQRCNLDCTLCYLSESSASVKDVPMDVLFRRIDRVRELYGPGVGVQVTGGIRRFESGTSWWRSFEDSRTAGCALPSSPTASGR